MKHRCPDWDYLEIDNTMFEYQNCLCKEKNMENKKDKSKFNKTLIRAYESKLGYLSVDIDSEAFDALSTVEVGGRILLKKVAQKKTDKSPDAYFEYMTPSQVSEMKAKYKSRFANSNKPDSDDVL